MPVDIPCQTALPPPADPPYDAESIEMRHMGALTFPLSFPGAVIEEHQYVAHYIYNGRPLDDNGTKAREANHTESEEAIQSSVIGGDDCAISICRFLAPWP